MDGACNNNQQGGELDRSRQTVCKQPDDHSRVEPSNDEELERLAMEAILQETKRAKLRADSVGAFGWKKKTLTTNKRFINAVVCGAVSSNRRQVAKGNSRTHVKEEHGREKRRRDEDKKRGKYEKDIESRDKRRKGDTG